MKDFPNSGWVEKQLGDVVTVTKIKGGSRPLAYVGLEDISSDGTGEFTGSLEPQGDKSTTFEFGPRHLLYGRLRPYLNKVYRPDFEGHCSSEIFPILPDQCLDRGYLFHWITSDQVVEKINATSTGARMPRANVKELLQFPIPLPPLEEQQRIVAILDEAFEGLARARAHAEANLQNARELFENYREEYLEPNSRDGWSSVQLDQLIDIKHGFAFKSAFFEDEGQHAVLTPGNYYETGGFKDRGEKQRYYSGEFPSEFILKKGDVLVAMTEQATGLLGSCMIVPEDDRFLHNQRLGLITPKNGVSWSAEYFAQAFNLKAFRKGLSDTCSGATVRHTSPKRILAESIPYCEDVAQLDLAAAHLSEREEDCRLMEKSYRAKVKDLDDLRQSLLQKAFAGELT